MLRYLAWGLLTVGLAGLAIAMYRYRRVDRVFLVTNGGLLVATVSRRGAPTRDADLMTGMLTAIMDFTKKSFSDERPRELDYFSLGDQTVEIVQGKHAYLAAVYMGRTRGSLERIMKSLLGHIEARYPQVRRDVVDTSSVGDLPSVLRHFVDRAWWPFLSFPIDAGSPSG